jgi:hypothetical protein
VPQKSEESPRFSDDELFDLLRRTSLNGFPNPDRKGCPSADVLETLALHPGQISVTDPVIAHVTHCSPCFSEVQRLRARSEKIG